MVKKITLTVSAAAVLLSACTSAPQTMYYWQDYSPTVYQRLKNDTSGGEQIGKMQKYFTDAQSRQMAAAPGAHAHMGLLLIEAGQDDAARRQFEAEKQLFPESAVFMDFLMHKPNGGITHEME